ncbi:MAG: hypothetical protein PHS46_03260 [Candidatus Omnitrophica bacterium]|nr:hypothetical protein [Candidatus Omnitrophota bacterium]
MKKMLLAAFVITAVTYLAVFDGIFYIKNIFSAGVIFNVPLPYIIVTVMFIFLYARLMNKKIKNIAYAAIAAAVYISLFYLLTDMKLGMMKNDPFGGNRGIFGLYGIFYYTVVTAAFSLIAGVSLSWRLKPVFCLPAVFSFVVVESMLLVNALWFYAFTFIIFFVLGVLLNRSRFFVKEIWRRAPGFLKDERIFLIALLIAAIAIRYFWGMRLLGITGANFIIASDDGVSYDRFATILAGGNIIPKEDALYVSGFGYWYFLGAAYKIFGVHNFKAIVLIQSLLGAMVPIITYRIGRAIFGNRSAPSIAAAFVAIDMNLIFLSVVIGMEAIYIPVVLCAIWYMVRLFSRIYNISTKEAFLAGCLFGLAQIIRPELLLFPFVLAALICIFVKNGMKLKKAFRVIVFLFAGFLILISVQGFITYRNYGVFYVVPSTGLQGAFSGGISDGQCIDENKTLDSMGFNPFKDMRGSIAVFFGHPAEVARLMTFGFLKRFIIFFFKPNFGTFDPFYLVNPGSGYVFGFPLFVQFYGLLFTIFGLFSAFLKKENIPAKTALVSFVALIAFQYSFVWVLNARYRGVVLPVIMLFMAYGITVFYKKAKENLS